MKYLSLFSGIGGFELGIQRSNKADALQCVGYSEVDKYAENIYKKHYPNHPRLGDVTQIRTEDLPDFEFLVGGFPCQAFSVAGQRKGFDDTRGTLFFEIARILQDKRPRYLLLENVPGLLYHNKGKTFQRILEILADLGYDAQWQILNSKNHGVPQNRRRIYIKGYSRDRCGREILSQPRTNTKITTPPIKTDTEKITTNDGNIFLTQIDKNIKATTTENGDMLTVTTKQRDHRLSHKRDNYIIHDPHKIIRVNEKPKHGIDHEANRLYSADGISPSLTCSSASSVNIIPPKTEETIQLRNNTKQGYLEGNEGDGVVLGQLNARRRIQKESSPTLCANGGVGTITRNNENKLTLRRITPIECERLQGFPDNWTKTGADGTHISDTQRYKCLGNAVTTTVVEHIINFWQYTKGDIA